MSFGENVLAPREIVRTGDDSPATSVWQYAIRMTAWHQGAACLLAVVVAILNLIPIELQRWIIDDAISKKDLNLLFELGIVYLAIIFLHQGLNFFLRLYQGWLSESAILYTRRHLLKLYRQRMTSHADDEGKAVSIICAEVEKLGGFVGEVLSQACVNITLLLGAVTYMFVVEPAIALVALGLLVPQIIVAPMIQAKLNALVERRLGLVRDLGNAIALLQAGDDDDSSSPKTRQIYSNRIDFFIWKFSLKALLNVLNLLAPLGVLVWGGWLVIEGETTVGVLVAFLSGLERIATPVRELIKFYRTAAQTEVQHQMIARWM